MAITHPVNVEMVDTYSSILQNALDSTIVDFARLNEKYGDSSIKDELDIINKSRSAQALLLASLVGKIRDPDWDTRFHEVKKMGGKHSLRGVSKKINAKLYLMSLILKPTDYACLTPAFKGVKAPFDEHFAGSIEPRESLAPLLHILKVINTTAIPALLNDMLVYILSVLNDNKKKHEAEKATTVICSIETHLNGVSNALDKLYALGAGSSKLPVIAVFTLLNLIQPYMWQSLSISPLKEHTEADKDRSYGDVEAYDSDSKPKIAIEIKHLISVDETITLTFDRKTEGKNIPLKFILTTAKTIHKFTPNNICIDTVNGFITRYLQMALVYEQNICSIFLQELRKQIIDHKNLKLHITQEANKILTSLLVSPSL